MKYAGKKAAFMPKSKTDIESPAEDTGENETTESKSTKKPVKMKGKSPALAAFISKKMAVGKKSA